MKPLAYSFLLFLFVSLTGCGTLNVFLKPHTTFSRDSTLTVVVESEDRLGIQGKLEHLLLNRGFEVVSQAVAKEKVSFESESNAAAMAKTASGSGTVTAGVIGTIKSEQSLSKVREVKSAFILRFRYHAFYDLIYWSFTSFNATIVELSSGKVVASASFSGGKSVDSVLEEFVKKLEASAN